MSEVHLVSSLEGPDDAPVLILANPIGTTRAIWDAQARLLREDYRLLRFELRGHGVIAGAEDQAAPPWHGAMTAAGITDSRLRVIRGASHLAPYQTPGPVTAAILGHLGVPERLR
jgi:pimeloyl-ACP methyl ester carboxylesterase